MSNLDLEKLSLHVIEQFERPYGNYNHKNKNASSLIIGELIKVVFPYYLYGVYKMNYNDKKESLLFRLPDNNVWIPEKYALESKNRIAKKKKPKCML